MKKKTPSSVGAKEYIKTPTALTANLVAASFMVSPDEVGIEP